MKKLLRLLEGDSRLSVDELALLCEKEKGEIAEMISAYEANGTILGYTALVDWDKTDLESVTAFIELKVVPQRDRGFDKIAEKISNYPEVKSVYLMSGSFDLALFIEGKTMKEVAFFVARKLSALEDVTATSTHFVLRKFKDKGVVFGNVNKDERGNNI
ncbi:MAG: Lrp/AsnC family transcriptional regulator [Clostridia bacterium]|nr:Lrp/AsnC family transcriptional regulator [Clostridia bacterium]